ncbi:hypothetical protein NDU88_009202 [Pleurodeles waltl]|uniref:Uncharacterized protein n=1 Tax=Pleurodeles waltl TaxID=8319 RepID=A0AAV7PRF1_PLEWA|nr:hypothetical protein NDU88_009202 [Pleurodeles waltl]
MQPRQLVPVQLDTSNADLTQSSAPIHKGIDPAVKQVTSLALAKCTSDSYCPITPAWQPLCRGATPKGPAAHFVLNCLFSCASVPRGSGVTEEPCFHSPQQGAPARSIAQHSSPPERNTHRAQASQMALRYFTAQGAVQVWLGGLALFSSDDTTTKHHSQHAFLPLQAAPSQRSTTAPRSRLGTGACRIPVLRPLSVHTVTPIPKSSPWIGCDTRRNDWCCGAPLQSACHVGSTSHALTTMKGGFIGNSYTRNHYLLG